MENAEKNYLPLFLHDGEGLATIVIDNKLVYCNEGKESEESEPFKAYNFLLELFHSPNTKKIIPRVLLDFFRNKEPLPERRMDYDISSTGRTIETEAPHILMGDGFSSYAPDMCLNAYLTILVKGRKPVVLDNLTYEDKDENYHELNFRDSAIAK